jgi:hypothetical protein
MRQIYKAYRLSIVAFIAGLILTAGCAKIGSPYGGPKDEDPPRVLKTDPPDSSVNFIPKRKITITFDEFIQLKDARQEIMLSPPIEGDLTSQVNGKKVVVEFPKDVEFLNTTYTLSFGNSIVDNNEGNVLENFEYIFSLKDYIDTLSVEGKVLDAYTLAPNEERMYVMLYKNLNDTAPLTTKPFYAARTNKEGKFSLHNLEDGEYRIFSLQDFNNNMLFDLPEETIAFSDSVIDLNPKNFKGDIVIEDSTLLALLNIGDTTTVDSLMIDSIRNETRLYTLYTQLLSFKEKTFNQYMTDDKRERAEKIFITFNEPLHEPLKIVPLDYPYSVTDSSWYVADISQKRDTCIYWLTDTSMINNDSLSFELSYHAYDTLYNLFLKTDTILFRFFETKKEQPEKRGGLLSAFRDEEQDTVQKAPTLELSNNIKKAGGFDLHVLPVLTSHTPIGKIREDRFELYRMEDTIPVEIPFELLTDTNSLYKLKINYEPEELTTYKMVILDSAVTDIYGLANDTIIKGFKTQSLDFYGILTLNMMGVSSPVILQLLNEKEEIIRSEKIYESQQVKFEYLNATSYLLKVIIDSNDNDEWDTGNYLDGLQPEEVIYYLKKLNVRSNWEIESSWDLESLSPQSE